MILDQISLTENQSYTHSGTIENGYSGTIDSPVLHLDTKRNSNEMQFDSFPRDNPYNNDKTH